MTQVCVLGAGAWGTALAKVLADKGNPTLVWSIADDVAASINEKHENRYLPGHRLPPLLRSTTSLEQALAGAEIVVMVVPSHAVREVAQKSKPLLSPNALVCSASKGIENDSLMLMSQVMEDVFGHAVVPRLTYLSGPSFAKE